jgi:hypothetical protein
VRADADHITVRSRGQEAARVTTSDGASCTSAGREVRQASSESPPLAHVDHAVVGGHASLEGMTGDVQANVTVPLALARLVVNFLPRSVIEAMKEEDISDAKVRIALE